MLFSKEYFKDYERDFVVQEGVAWLRTSQKRNIATFWECESYLIYRLIFSTSIG